MKGTRAEQVLFFLAPGGSERALIGQEIDVTDESRESGTSNAPFLKLRNGDAAWIHFFREINMNASRTVPCPNNRTQEGFELCGRREKRENGKRDGN